MFGSIRLGSVLGVKVRAHFLLLVLFGVIVVANRDSGVAAALVVSIWFGLVLLHELGHCLVARHFGIEVIDITLWPLGGMARMSEIPESSRIEGLIAIAGPAVNLALALVALPFWLLAEVTDAPLLELLLRGFLYINLAMGLFNLLPLFPTDGGRILRAWFGRKGDWVGATESAVGVGRFFSLALGATGLLGIPLQGGYLLPPNYMLTLIAIYLWWVGSQELMLVKMRHARGPFGVFADFARRARAAERAAARAYAAEQGAADEPPGVRPAARGIDEDEVERLERWRGSLRTYRSDDANP